MTKNSPFDDSQTRLAAVEAAIARACDTIAHRGPDDWGVHIDSYFGMGMRLLSIIDLAGGHQPIFSPDRRWAIVFNGEIYNHPQLRPELYVVLLTCTEKLPMLVFQSIVPMLTMSRVSGSKKIVDVGT